MRWLITFLGLTGGAAAGHLGMRWLENAARQQNSSALTPFAEHELVMQGVAGYVLIAAMVAAVVGGLLAWQHRGRSAGTVLLVAGVVPGIFDLRAFVVTCVLILASMLAFGLAGPARAPARAWSRMPSTGG